MHEALRLRESDVQAGVNTRPAWSHLLGACALPDFVRALRFGPARALDRDGSGSIQYLELKRACKRLGPGKALRHFRSCVHLLIVENATLSSLSLLMQGSQQHGITRHHAVKLFLSSCQVQVEGRRMGPFQLLGRGWAWLSDKTEATLTTTP